MILPIYTGYSDIVDKCGGNQSITKYVFFNEWTPAKYILEYKNFDSAEPAFFNEFDINTLTYTCNRVLIDLTNSGIVMFKLILDDHLLDVSDSELDTPPTKPTEGDTEDTTEDTTEDAEDTTEAPVSPMDTDGNANANADPPLNCLGSEKNSAVVPPPTGRDNDNPPG